MTPALQELIIEWDRDKLHKLLVCIIRDVQDYYYENSGTKEIICIGKFQQMYVKEKKDVI